jgi:hypothetical protein
VVKEFPDYSFINSQSSHFLGNKKCFNACHKEEGFSASKDNFMYMTPPLMCYSYQKHLTAFIRTLLFYK